MAVATLAVLAGCGGLPGADSTERDPYGVPTTTATGETGEPTGTTTSVDRLDPEFEAVVLGHVRTVGRQSVTLIERRTVRDGNGTVRRERETVVRAGVGKRRSVRTTVEGAAVPEAVRVERWSNATVEFTRRDGGDGPRDGRGDRDVTRGDRLLALFATLQPTAWERRNGTTVYRAERASAPTELDAGDVRRPRNVSLVAVVGESGAVRRYRLSYAGTVEGRTVEVVEVVRFVGVGETTVERPDWVERRLADRDERAGSFLPPPAVPPAWSTPRWATRG